MSFAFGALLIVLLLLPGIVFRYTYIRSNSLRRSLDFSLLNEAITMVIVAILLHAIGVKVAGWLGITPDYRLIYLIGTGEGLEIDDYRSITSGYSGFVGYTLVLCGLASAIGFGLQQFVLRRGYDQQYKGLRVLNDWDRYFTGHVLTPEQRAKLNFTRIDLLVDGSGGKAVLYSGVLENYSLNRDQVIDQLFVSSAIRRSDFDLPPTTASKEDKYAQPANYDMPGDYFVIPYSQVRNINIVYSFLEEVVDTTDLDTAAG